jgi:hypothetical protein
MTSIPHIPIQYRPHGGGQKAFHAAGARKGRIVICGRRWGKDRSAIADTVRTGLKLARRRLKWGTGIHVLEPLVHIWVVAPDYPRLRQWWRELKRFVPVGVKVHTDATAKAIELSLTRDGTPHVLIELKSASDPESLVSVGLDLLVITEGAMVKERAWTESLMPCCMSPGRAGLYVINGTPKGRNWVYHEFKAAQQDMLEHGANSKTWCIQAPTISNPYIDREWYEWFAAKMPHRKRKQELLAEFLGAGDAFFPDPRKRVLTDDFEVLAPIIIGIDWGRRDNPTVFFPLDGAGRQVAEPMELRNEPFDSQFAHLHQFVESMPCDPGDIVFAPEEVMLQSMFTDRIASEFEVGRKGHPKIEPFLMNARNKEMMYDNLAFDLEEVNPDGIWLLEDPETLNQIEVFEESDLRGTRQVKRDEDFGSHHFDRLVGLGISNQVRHWLNPGGGPTIVVDHVKKTDIVTPYDEWGT